MQIHVDSHEYDPKYMQRPVDNQMGKYIQKRDNTMGTPRIRYAVIILYALRASMRYIQPF